MDKKLQEAIRMYHSGNYNEAITMLKSFISDNQDVDGMGHFYLGLSFYDSGKLADAEDYLRKAVAINPGSSNYNYRLGLVCARLMRFSDAVSFLTKSIELSQENLRAKYILGTIYFKLGKLHEAKRLFEDIISHSAENASATYYLGLCDYHLGNLESAEKYFLKTLEINDEYVDAHIKLGNLYFGKHDYEKAEMHYSKSYSRGINEISLLLNYSLALMGVMKYTEAEEILTVARVNYPNNQEIEKLLEVFKDIKNL